LRSKIRNNLNINSDKRTNEIDQLIKGIVTIKSYVIQNIIVQRILNLRVLEFNSLFSSNIYLALSSSTFFTFSQISILFMVIAQIYLGEIHNINVNTIFFATMILSNLKN